METAEQSADKGAARTAGVPVPQPAAAVRYLLLIRHGQATFNLDGRHPGQLPGVPLTDAGRRQAHAAAVALSALPLTTVIASPLDRARETAEIVARGWAMPVRLEPRLMDTDVGSWAGKKPAELKDDPAWKAFVEHPTEPPPGVESLATVQARALAVVTEALGDPATGNCVVLVTHGDIVKLVLGHYLGTSIDCARYIAVANASITALAFSGEAKPQEAKPEVLAVNWTPSPRWLSGPPAAAPITEATPSALPAEGVAGAGVADTGTSDEGTDARASSE